ncbi:hypothetical protein AJ80_05949 [Polytolypa hystricis UAMH7299]|uniref:Phosphoribosylaminoimidazole-succinocarboxamide synthase n=1 Tax=Polytolypa hystricis (strain UAMH7299) TaxID=1447883 RepID=A0A2B7XZM0_POLH7|nr:hypothetical protein AJ80_05949 [Polytolypa hystricis UAMH7299]
MPGLGVSANLRSVNRSHPQLIRSPSQQSIAASDDYYSFSDPSLNSNNSKVTVLRYETPPSRNPSPGNISRRNNPQDSTARSLGPVQGPATKGNQAQLPDNMPPSTSNPNQNNAGSSERPHDSGTPTPGVDDTPYIRFAIDQLTRDEELTGRGRQASTASMDYPVERIVSDEGLGYTSGTKRVDRPKTPKEKTESGDFSYFFAPISPPDDGYNYPRLDFIPFVLRPVALASLITVCLAMCAALIFCNIWSQRHDGLWAYSGFGDSRYFVFQFLPQLLAILITIWLFVLQSAVYRITPLSILASPNPSHRALQDLPIRPRNFLLPELCHFMHGEFLVGIFLLVMWIVNIFAVPLQSCLFQTRYYGDVGQGGFRWTSVQPVAWTLVALYGLLVLALLIILFRFARGESGLMWDPVCLADIIPLIQRSNILPDFDGTEVAPDVSEALSSRPLRLGYWSTKDHEILYGIGDEHRSLGGDASENTSQKEKEPAAEASQPDVDLEQQQLNTKGSFERMLHSPFTRYRWTAWFLRDTFVVAWILFALVFLIAFLVVSFVNRAIENGFLPLLPTLASSSGFSSSNFLYNFIPALLGMVLFLLWQPIDLYFRAVQPFASLSSPHGASAETSLLLSYPSCLPFEVTFLALISRHYKVAYISFMATASLAIPVLAGGVFMARFYVRENQVRISSYMPAYYTLIGFLAIYALSFLFVWPRRQRYLPHAHTSYADVISFLYQSPLLADKVFREPKTNADLVARAMVAPPGEGDTALYAFGVYRGRDGKEHLGIDRLKRPGRAEMLVSPT